MFQAVWNGTVLAGSGQTVKLEGNREVPPGCYRADEREGRS